MRGIALSILLAGAGIEFAIKRTDLDKVYGGNTIMTILCVAMIICIIFGW